MGAAISEPMVNAYLKDLKSALNIKNPQDLAKQNNEELNSLESTTLNIAITGVSGAGKSSLVNALRGMEDSEEGAAKTGNIETTMFPKDYPCPTFPKVVLWDLPGIGTTNFQAKEYLEKINFEKYDFFIIVSAQRFSENDVHLAKEIQKMEKKYYFVRSKIDQSIEADKRKKKSSFNEDETLEEIRKDCCENLRKAGDANPRVFLLSSWDLSKYDFSLLEDTLENELEGLKRQVLIESMPGFSREALQKKKAAMEDYIWKVAIVSCVIGAVPVPGLSLACDIPILMATMVKFCFVFGLDEETLGRLAQRADIPVEELKSEIKKVPLANQITAEFVIILLTKSAASVALNGGKFAIKFIPVLGSLIGGAASFATTFYMMKSFLSDVEEDAVNVRAKAKVLGQVKCQATENENRRRKAAPEFHAKNKKPKLDN